MILVFGSTWGFVLLLDLACACVMVIVGANAFRTRGSSLKGCLLVTAASAGDPACLTRKRRSGLLELQTGQHLKTVFFGDCLMFVELSLEQPV